MSPRSMGRTKATLKLVTPLIIGTVALAVVVVACAYMVWDAHRQVGLRAHETVESIVQLLERDVGRNLEVLDLSLQAVTDGVARPEIMSQNVELKKMVLFDRSASATGLGALIVFDKNGNNVLDSLHDNPAPIQPVIDREYFQAQTAADKGLFVSRVYQSRLINQPVIGLSRRINDGRGDFLGVALATIELGYLSELISKIQIGPGAVVTVLRSDGVALLRQSPNGIETNLDVSKLPSFQRMSGKDSGEFVSTSQYDHIERLYGFKQIGKYPLMLSVGISTQTIYSDWRQKSTMLVVLITLMTAIVFGLLAKLLRELKHRATTEKRLVQLNHKLEKLSLTDSLTGLGNRRYFDEVFGHEIRRSQRTGLPISLALIDIDHFKLFNDHYGHAEGDHTLRLVADALKSCLKKPGNMAFRIGGEEFAVVLPETDGAGAAIIGESLCRAVRSLRREHIKSEAGYVTISVGLSAGRDLDPLEAFEIADNALYAAKRSGRNRVTPMPLSLAG